MLIRKLLIELMIILNNIKLTLIIIQNCFLIIRCFHSWSRVKNQIYWTIRSSFSLIVLNAKAINSFDETNEDERIDKQTKKRENAYELRKKANVMMKKKTYKIMMMMKKKRNQTNKKKSKKKSKNEWKKKKKKTF